MQKLWIIFKKIIWVFSVFLLHVIITNILPYPFNHISIIYLAVFYAIFLSDQPRNIWLIAPLIFLLELFAPTPFGLNLISYFITPLFMSWLFINIFNSRALPVLVFYFSLGLFAYRFCFYTIEYFTGYFISGVSSFNLGSLLLNTLIENALTTLVMIVFHIFYSTFNKKFNPKYLIS